GTVFWFAMACSVASGMIFGLAPARAASKADINEVLKQSSLTSTPGRSNRRFPNAPTVAQVAFALASLTCAAAFLGGLNRLTRIDPGWNADEVLVAQLNLSGPKYEATQVRLDLFERLRDRLSSIPNVQDVSLSARAPSRGAGTLPVIRIEDQPDLQVLVLSEPVSSQYFETLGITLKQGRTFTAEDRRHEPEGWIINETMARRFWRNESAIGKRIGFGPRQWHEVIGVVNDVKYLANLGMPITDLQVYRPLVEGVSSTVTVELRTSSRPEMI